MSVDWTAVAAVGTWAAVLVALFLPSWQNRRRLALSFQLNGCLIFGDETLLYIAASCVNVGPSDVVIKGYGLIIGDVDSVYVQVVSVNPVYRPILSPEVPCRLVSGDSFSCGFEKKSLGKRLKDALNKGLVQSDDLLDIYFVDSIGRRYRKSLNVTAQMCIDGVWE